MDSVIHPTSKSNWEQVSVINSVNGASWGGCAHGCSLGPSMCSECFALMIRSEVALRCCASSVLAEMILCAVCRGEMLLLCLVGVEGLGESRGHLLRMSLAQRSLVFGQPCRLPSLLEPGISGTHLLSQGRHVSKTRGMGRAAGSQSSSSYFSQNLD